MALPTAAIFWDPEAPRLSPGRRTQAARNFEARLMQSFVEMLARREAEQQRSEPELTP